MSIIDPKIVIKYHLSTGEHWKTQIMPLKSNPGVPAQHYWKVSRATAGIGPFLKIAGQG